MSFLVLCQACNVHLCTIGFSVHLDISILYMVSMLYNNNRITSICLSTKRKPKNNPNSQGKCIILQRHAHHEANAMMES